MTSFLLVHGAWHAAWCWEKLIPILDAAGDAVLAIDLPGHGDDRTPAAEVTLASYGEAVCRGARSLPPPVVAVAHSMGGYAMSQAAESRPDHFDALIYLCAFLPRDGCSLVEMFDPRAREALARAVETDAADGSTRIRRGMAREIFYGDCSDEDAARAEARLGRDPSAPVTTPIRISAERYGRIPRAYVECTRDAILPLANQRAMVASVGCVETVTLDTGHSPFLSAPVELVGELRALATRLLP
jgi:pimeloyl-ACP methyl ester carboxylesterase